MGRRRTVAVIGGGCAGVLLTRELLRCTGDDVVLIEPGKPGGGIAYGTAQPWHVLNSRAGTMSADPDEPDHFVHWANARGIPATRDDFLSRRDYGRYLSDVLADAATACPGRLRILRGHARSIRTASVSMMDDSMIRADHIVLAVGNPAAEQPAAVPNHPNYVADPWRAGALDAVPADAPVLLLGTGLTAVDVALSLTATGHHPSAPIVAVSRRGLLPLSHSRIPAPPALPALAGCRTLRDVVRTVRAAARTSGDWRPIVDGLRPWLDQLWAAFAPAEQEAFLRHLARPWECHRHRMAPDVADRIAALRTAGTLEVRRGGVRSIGPERNGGLFVELNPVAERFAAVVNCAGPGRLPAAAPTVVRDLLDAGVARIGPHRLGLDVDAAGRLVGADGSVQPGLWVLGPLRRGVLWETTAVPEIRAQARGLAAGLSEQSSVPVPAAA
ncbi:MAG TPA: FAD/NAD(P)-binding protein [Actinoplanes sp.]